MVREALSRLDKIELTLYRYSLSLATSIMFWMVLKRPVVTNARVRASRQW